MKSINQFRQKFAAAMAVSGSFDDAFAECISDAYYHGAGDAWAQCHRLAMELECLLLSCNDNAAVSKWWDSAHEALEDYRRVSSEGVGT